MQRKKLKLTNTYQKTVIVPLFPWAVFNTISSANFSNVISFSLELDIIFIHVITITIYYLHAPSECSFVTSTLKFI